MMCKLILSFPQWLVLSINAEHISDLVLVVEYSCKSSSHLLLAGSTEAAIMILGRLLFHQFVCRPPTSLCGETSSSSSSFGN